MTLVLGIDGGQSSTRTLLANDRGEILGRHRTGPSNHIDEPGGLERQYRALHGGMLGAFAAAGLEPQRVAVACVGLTGSGHLPTIERALDTANVVRHLGDIETAFAGAIPDQVGTVLIAGTGAIALGRDATGRSHRTGGWGYLAGDEGAGYDLGVQALRALFRELDGRGPATALTPPLLAHFGAKDIPDLRYVIYRPGITRDKIAAAASFVGKVALQGDRVAQSLLRNAAHKLAELITGVLDQLDPSAGQAIVPVGGVIRAGEPILEPLRQRVLEKHPDSTFTQPVMDAARGAVLLALREAGVNVTPEVVARLRGAGSAGGPGPEIDFDKETYSEP